MLKRRAALRVDKPAETDLMTRQRRSPLKLCDISASLLINKKTEAQPP